MELTKSQLEDNIAALNSSKNDYYQKIENYEQSAAYIKQIKSSLQSSYDSLENARGYLDLYFKVGNKTADKGTINNIKNDISDIMKKISEGMESDITNAISSANNSISNLNTKINDYQQQYSNLNDET